MDSNENTYVIFARTKYEEPLTELGPVTVEADTTLSETARAAYPGDEWLEMIAVPEAALLSVLVERRG